MKNYILLLLFWLVLSGYSAAQCVITLQPGPGQGKDSRVFELSCSSSYAISTGNCQTTNYSYQEVVVIASWTYEGTSADSRVYLEFDLNALNQFPCSAEKAILTLSHGGTEDHCGSSSTWRPCNNNTFRIHRVTGGAWDSETILWTNMPSFSNTDYIEVGDSSHIPFHNYEIDITDMVNFWIAHPDSNFGMCIKLAAENNHYKQVRFASSENINPSLRPKLSIALDCAGNYCNNIISGNIYDDMSKNCALDTSDNLLNNWLVKIEPGPMYASTDVHGNYTASVDVGSYTVTPILPNNHLWSDSCAPSYQVDFTSNDTFATNINFPLQASNYCADLWVDIAVARMRKCHNEWFKVQYCNKGNIAENNAYIDVMFSEFILPQSASIPYTTNPDGSLRFNIGTISPYECGTFTISTLIDCNVEFGITQCAQATIYPRNICEEIDSTWDKSSVMVTGVCKNDSAVCFKIYNTGDADGNMTALSQWRLYADNTLIESGNFMLNGQDSLELCFTANGQTLRLEADQRPGHPGNSHPNASIENCGNNGSPIVSLTSMPQDDSDNHTEIYCDIIRASYDPNEKLEKPIGFGDMKYIYANDELEYLINFQNTGNDTAYLVIVRDTLPVYLNPATIVSGVSSHPYKFRLMKNGIIEWRFDNIKLVDSTTNEPESHGFVKFKIKQRPNNAEGTVIKNRVGIYFDFNEPVITEYTWNVIWQDTATSISKLMNENDLSVLAFPNPAEKEINFLLNKQGFYTIRIYNNMGQIINEKYFSQKNTSLDVSTIPDGIYFYNINGKNGESATGKFIKN